MRKVMMKRSLASWCVLSVSLSVAACGSLNLSDEKSSSDTDSGSTKKTERKQTEGQFQLKGAVLLSSHSENSFGPKMDLVESSERQMNGNAAPKVSIFTKYQNSFGTQAGLKIEDKFSDGPSEAYFLALSIAGDAIARNCETDIRVKAEKSKCYCATKESAQDLLQRSLSHWDFNDPAKADFISKFVDGCKNSKTYRATIGGLINSLAFVQR